ncbi:LLM class flavin-dependent oxidoreductase [Streptomyces scopuliridis]|uniref:LLM class flavin-dependent oxidoreductase n=1 Tax=Streptomyces scopuliridis TaxID=452529 RepID=UPI0035D8EA0B
MHVGIELGFGNLHDDLADEDVYAGSVRLARLAEHLRFDSVWAVEHHFSNYSMCPDNILFLTHVAAVTERLLLATGAVILPWHDPVRVAERMIMLDILSGGRAVLGLGRGLSRSEYEAFRIPMGESRGRFDEAARMVINALETGFIEGVGPFYPQPRAELRPRPIRPFTDRVYCVAGSPGSATVPAELRAGLLTVVTKPLAENLAVYRTYRDAFRARHGTQPPPVMCVLNMYCAPDGQAAREFARVHLERFYLANVQHYELTGAHFSGIPGYEQYAHTARTLHDSPTDAEVDRYLEASLVGSPDELVARIAGMRDLVGDLGIAVTPVYGGMPYAEAEASLELFGKEVLPEIRGQGF